MRSIIRSIIQRIFKKNLRYRIDSYRNFRLVNPSRFFRF